MTVRIDRNLLNEVKRAARSDGRSVSAEVVHILRRELAPRERTLSTRSVEGLFAHREVSEDLEDYRLGEWLDRALERRARRLPKRTVR